MQSILENIFSGRAKVKALRFLLKYKPEMSGREIARNIGVSHVQVLKVLEELARDGFVLKKQVGKTFSFGINSNNNAVTGILKEVFEKEETYLDEMLNSIIKDIWPGALSVYLFGSMAGKKQRPGSDIDLFFVVKGAGEKAKAQEKALVSHIETLKTTGRKVSALIVTLAEFKKMLKANKELVENIKQGRVLKGKSLGKL